ncbi:LysR family transcriptional regulator [Nonomuraea sp. NPDC048881]|uniref:helix-turn-helix domain-containing protein n=1 Tax=Nonomuraea sp. NPDC048881 TaxID=3155030 RepID=UPI0033F3B902
MELRDIEIFLPLAEEPHFGRTAARLHVSPARISQAIQTARPRRLRRPRAHPPHVGLPGDRRGLPAPALRHPARLLVRRRHPARDRPRPHDRTRTPGPRHRRRDHARRHGRDRRALPRPHDPLLDPPGHHLPARRGTDLPSGAVTTPSAGTGRGSALLGTMA